MNLDDGVDYVAVHWTDEDWDSYIAWYGLDGAMDLVALEEEFRDHEEGLKYPELAA
jgi:hypothetical protein